MKQYCVLFWSVINNNNIKSREIFSTDTKREAIEIAHKNRNLAEGPIHVRKLNRNRNTYETEIVID